MTKPQIPLDRRIQPVVWKVLNAAAAGDKMREEDARADLAEKVGMRNVLPRTFTDQELEDSDLTARRAACVIEIRQRPGKKPRQPIAVCRKSVQ